MFPESHTHTHTHTHAYMHKYIKFVSPGCVLDCIYGVFREIMAPHVCRTYHVDAALDVSPKARIPRELDLSDTHTHTHTHTYTHTHTHTRKHT